MELIQLDFSVVLGKSPFVFDLRFLVLNSSYYIISSYSICTQAKSIGVLGGGDKTFITPEEVMNYFVDVAKNGDLNKMPEAFAPKTTAQKFDFTAYSKM